MKGLSVCSFIMCLFCVNAVRVKIDVGTLEGGQYVSKSGKQIFTFFGVPYARPPVGEDRFKEPKAAKAWSGVWPATKHSPACLQYVSFFNNECSQQIVGNEDCLYLNIYTPRVSKSAKLPVLVYFHGGAFMFGDSKSVNPTFFLENHDIVFVSVNYRLGPFGFLSTQDDIVPGNNGLKDQVLALKWIQEHIVSFGGDKQQVTIAGNSAGGASVHLHYLSPLSHGLFDKGISSSGSALMPWVIAEEPLQKAKALANSLGCPTGDNEDMIACLKRRPSKQILTKLQPLFMPWHSNPFSPFGPVVEHSKKNAFLSEDPYRLLKDGDVCDRPWLASVTSEEGLFPTAVFIDREEVLKTLNRDWLIIAPNLLDFNNTCSSTKRDVVSYKIKQYYFGASDVSANSSKIIEMASDRLFKSGMGAAVIMQASAVKSSVYFYEFAYRGKTSLTVYLSRSQGNFGVSHFDDIYYLLSPPSSAQYITESDRAMMSTMTSMWYGFIKTGKPAAPSGVQWSRIARKSVKNNNLSRMYIKLYNSMYPVETINFGNYQFWKSLGLKENF